MARFFIIKFRKTPPPTNHTEPQHNYFIMAESKHLILAPSREAAIASDASSTPLTHRLVFGALAGMGAATFCHPLDVIRVQMQTEGVQYTNTMDAATKIYSRSGLVEGLYAGVSAAYLRQWMYGSFRIGIYSYLLEQTQNENERMGRDKNDIPFSRKLAMGCCSGGIGSFIGTPSELALVRLSADSKLPPAERRNYANVVDCIVRISKEEGVTNLWRGVTPTVLRATVLSSAQLGEFFFQSFVFHSCASIHVPTSVFAFTRRHVRNQGPLEQQWLVWTQWQLGLRLTDDVLLHLVFFFCSKHCCKSF